MSVPNNQIFHKSDPGQQENPYLWLMKRRTMAARISLPSAYRPASSVDVAVQKTVNHRIKRSSFYSLFLCGKYLYLIREEYLKTKKKAIPMTTPRPAIPRENFIQHEHRDSDPALKKNARKSTRRCARYTCKTCANCLYKISHTFTL